MWKECSTSAKAKGGTSWRKGKQRTKPQHHTHTAAEEKKWSKGERNNMTPYTASALAVNVSRTAQRTKSQHTAHHNNAAQGPRHSQRHVTHTAIHTSPHRNTHIAIVENKWKETTTTTTTTTTLTQRNTDQPIGKRIGSYHAASYAQVQAYSLLNVNPTGCLCYTYSQA